MNQFITEFDVFLLGHLVYSKVKVNQITEVLNVYIHLDLHFRTSI